MVCISRRAWAASVVVLLAWAITCPAEEEPLFTFLQFSDVHVGNDINKPVHKRLVAAVTLANALKPSFVIDSGDMTTHPVYEANPENLAELDEYRKYIAHLTIPIYPLPGNHDIGYFDYTGSKYEEDCEPGATGSGAFCFYSDWPPAQITNSESLLAIKSSGEFCYGELTGYLPMCSCPTAADGWSWSGMKVMFK